MGNTFVKVCHISVFIGHAAEKLYHRCMNCRCNTPKHYTCIRCVSHMYYPCFTFDSDTPDTVSLFCGCMAYAAMAYSAVHCQSCAR